MPVGSDAVSLLSTFVGRVPGSPVNTREREALLPWLLKPATVVRTRESPQETPAALRECSPVSGLSFHVVLVRLECWHGSVLRVRCSCGCGNQAP